VLEPYQASVQAVLAVAQVFESPASLPALGFSLSQVMLEEMEKLGKIFPGRSCRPAADVV
jgi:hypothetical protein